MRNDNLIKGKLYGVGIGPGDPKLLTLKAKEALEKADIIFAPKGSDEGISVARGIIEQVIENKKTYVELTFPMTKDKNSCGSIEEGRAKDCRRAEKRQTSGLCYSRRSIYLQHLYLSFENA